jgi:Acyl carrier protein
MTQLTAPDIQRFISERLLDGQAVAADEDLLLSGLLDSLGVMTLVAYLESHLGRKIPAQDITVEHFSSVATITEYLDGA